ncbi:hypothetical protein KIN34_06420 [Cellulomonas sp. DKR-3]|uniref:Uncharacterized protein n=1 Tax=Cellulomonas fulva TaxID=2835530 RepID=A0ABS5TXT4_9CELL|nr:hypothetical protein [Cellulomonas fulva]MBT0993920.1 hypothetical protein [Cellulomonas fulva]
MPRRQPPPSPWALVAAPLAVRLAVARDPGSTSEQLVVVAPSLLEARDPSMDEIVRSVVLHASCPGPVASRFVGHPDPVVRRAILDVPGLPATTLDALAHDREPDIADRARALLAQLNDAR